MTRARPRAAPVYISTPPSVYTAACSLDDTQQDQACPTGLHFLGDNMPGTANRSTEAGQRPTVTSTIFGSFESSGNASIDLGSWNFHHNVTFEDDIDIDFSTRELSLGDIALGNVRDDFVFNMASPARSGSGEYTDGGQSVPAAQCSYSEDREAVGNKVIFAGDLDQDIRYTAGETFRIEALQLNKLEDDNSVYLRSGAALSVTDLEVRSGKLITNGRLDLSPPEDRRPVAPLSCMWAARFPRGPRTWPTPHVMPSRPAFGIRAAVVTPRATKSMVNTSRRARRSSFRGVARGIQAGGQYGNAK